MTDRRPATLHDLTPAHYSNQWDVIIEGRRHPPKAITALAHELAGSGRPSAQDISGRSAHGYLHERLTALGFAVVARGMA